MSADPVDTPDPVDETPRQTFDLEETGFIEVPKKWRRFYRYWNGVGDAVRVSTVRSS